MSSPKSGRKEMTFMQSGGILRMRTVWKCRGHTCGGEFCMVSGGTMLTDADSLSSLGKGPRRLLGGRAACSRSLVHPPREAGASQVTHSWSLVSFTVADVCLGSQRRTPRGCLKGGERVHPRTTCRADRVSPEVGEQRDLRTGHPMTHIAGCYVCTTNPVPRASEGCSAALCFCRSSHLLS